MALPHTELAKKFYRSKKWRKCRASYIAKVDKHGGLCEHCKDRAGYIVDHIIPIDITNINNPEITLNHDNLQYLCIECHNVKTFKGKKKSAVPDGCMFDDEGNLILVDDESTDK